MSHPLGQCAALLVDLRGGKVWISANGPAAERIAISTGPYLTLTARLLNTLHYRSPMGKVRQNRVLKIDVWEWEPFPAQFRMKELNYNATNVPVGMGTVPRCTTCELLM